MAKSPEALVEPSLLIWARESAGLSPDEVAAKLKVKLGKVEAWEHEDSRPSIAQLRRLSTIYKRPLAVFFLPEPPRDFMPVRDYRRLADRSAPEEVSPALRAEIRRVLELHDAAIGLLEDREESELPWFPVEGRISDDPELLAHRIRETLGVPHADQANWPDEFTALREWREAIERLGVLIVQASGVELDEMRGFSLADPDLPLICFNSTDTATGRIFTLMHELTHIALREGGLCEWDHPQKQSAENARFESFCNWVSGAILVPASELLSDPIVGTGGGARSWSNDEIRELARKFSVSREVVLRRLVIIGRANEAFYRQKRDELLEEYKRLPKPPSFPVAYEKRIANALGHSFIQLVLGSYHERRLTLAEASSLIGVRVKHLPAIEHEVMGWSHIRTART